MKVLKTKSAEETKNIGKIFASELEPGDVVLFYGNLGAGKTTFIQGLAEGLGITDRILSPTFVLERTHKVNVNSISYLHHIDLYRIEGQDEINNMGLFELIDEINAVVIVEWAEKLKKFKPKRGYKIELNYLEENTREIKIDKFNQS